MRVEANSSRSWLLLTLCRRQAACCFRLFGRPFSVVEEILQFMTFLRSRITPLTRLPWNIGGQTSITGRCRNATRRLLRPLYSDSLSLLPS